MLSWLEGLIFIDVDFRSVEDNITFIIYLKERKQCVTVTEEMWGHFIDYLFFFQMPYILVEMNGMN